VSTAAKPAAYVGRSILRVEDRRLLTGTGQYADDFNCAGQLHAHIVRSNVSHGVIRALSTERAARSPGVVKVITAADIPDVRIPIRLFATENAERALQPPLARERVRYVGEPVAVVVADDPYQAEDAAEAVELDVESLAPMLDPAEAAEASAVALHDTGSNLIDRMTIVHGSDTNRLLEEAAVRVRQRFHVQRHGAVPMENRGLLAEWDEAASRLSVWGAAKVKHFNRRILADLLGVPEETVRCVEGDVGGGFGARGEFYPEDFLIPWLALALERPVKWAEDRRENLMALNHSREQDWEVEYGADGDGRLLAFRAKALFNQGAYVRTHGSVLLPALMLNHMPGPYRWQAYDVEAATVLTNKTPAGTYRGPGQYEPTFVRERMVDLVARELGMEPTELRRRNLVSKAEMPYDTGLPDVDTGNTVLYEEGDFPLVFERLLERTGYDELRRQVDAQRAESRSLGLAATAFIEMGNPGVFEQARVVPGGDGTFTAHVGVASVGQGVQTVLSQVTADVLGVPIERIHVSYHDTSVVPEGQGAFSSRATVYGGYAISGAVADLKDNARAAAAERLEAAPEDLVIEGDRVLVRGSPASSLTYDELGVEGSYRYEPAGGSHVLMGANVALVDVDRDSGGVQLLRYAIAYEVGRAINPQTLEGQVQGAAAQGIGGAMFEEFAYTPDGQPLCTSFIDYLLPTAAEIPDIDVVLVELGERSADDPLAGAKGGGEGGIIATAATIANAIADALGPPYRGLTSLPLTPEVVSSLQRGERETR
jgi:carbon-monoxide dehydrogenase large subunit